MKFYITPTISSWMGTYLAIYSRMKTYLDICLWGKFDLMPTISSRVETYLTISSRMKTYRQAHRKHIKHLPLAHGRKHIKHRP